MLYVSLLDLMSFNGIVHRIGSLNTVALLLRYLLHEVGPLIG